MELRPYQKEAVEAVYQHLRERNDNPCVVLPTGTGKSILLAQIASDVVNRWKGRVLILAHVKELLEQNAEKLKAIAPDLSVGIYSAGLKSRDTSEPVIIAGIQSVYQRAAELDAFDIVMVDECHLIPPDGEGRYRTFLAEAQEVNPNLRLVGLTATPYRMSSGMICAPENLLNHVCYEAGVREMMAQGYLSHLKSKAGCHKPDFGDLHIRAGEFIASEVESLMGNDELVRSACTEIVDLTQSRKSVLIFAAGVEHCYSVAKEIERLTGHECGVITGDTASLDRETLIDRFRGKRVSDGLFDTLSPLKFLVNCQVLTHGFDAPNVDAVVLLRPTNSPGLYVQMVGRGTRIHPDKDDCLILDYGGNILRHGPIDALAIKASPSGDGEAPAKECPECRALIHAAYRICPDCGFEFPPAERGRHGGSASTAEILSGEVTDTVYEVLDVFFQVHTKRGASPDAPRTLRVDYKVGFNDYRREWVCFEHDGFARQKAEKWWRERSNDPVPESIERAVEVCEAGAIADTYSIKVRSVAGEKYDRIVSYELGEKPELCPVLESSNSDWSYDPDEEMPF